MAHIPAQDPLVGRIEAMLADEPSVRRVAMFGGQSFMVNDKLAVGVFGDGHLLVRVDADRGRELLERPGASVSEMGAGRTMGPGWLRVEAAAVADDEQLGFWVGEALAFNARARRSKRSPRGSHVTA